MQDLRREIEAPGRVLVGVDFSLGYPTGFAEALGLTGTAWRQTWTLLAQLIDDDRRNANNRFRVASELNGRVGEASAAGPFWGCPPGQRSTVLTSTKVSPDPLPEWRLVEAVLRQRGHRPFSSWQLLGAGSVGSQSLTGIASLAPLLDEHAGQVDVWPFTTGLSAPQRRVVIAEVWPTMFELPPLGGRVRDDQQVRTVAEALFAAARQGALGSWFSPNVGGADRLRSVEREEGWILGA